MKKILIFSIIALSLLVSSITSFAAVEYGYTSSGHSFISSWTEYDGGTNWVIEYGFNTFLINEDFTHTKHNTTSHIAKVRNDSGTFTDGDSAGYWALVDVRHNGSSIYYSITF